jgi:ElaB/YqjD/DUF883 family membrane-anchored ribosome-binding protein
MTVMLRFYAKERSFMEQNRGPGSVIPSTEKSDKSVKSVGSVLSHGRDAIGAAATDAAESAGGDLKALQNDLNSLKDTVTRFISQATNEASKSARDIGDQLGNVANDMTNRGVDMAFAATEQAKSFAVEAENMVRRNPLGAVACAVVLGVLIGSMGRRS